MNADDADAVRRLYALPPDEFVEARNDAAQRAGSRDEAARIRKLRRPTVAAWAVNLLVADAPGDIDALAGLGERLRAAQAEMRGGDLRELSAERNRTVSALVRRASDLAREAGHPLPGAAQREVETTLDAAVADPDSAEAVRAGTLTKTMAYSGTGFTGATPLVTEPRRAESRTASQPGRQAKPGSRSEPEAKSKTRPEARAKSRTRPEAGTKGENRSGAKTGGKDGTRTDAQARKESEARREARRRAVAKAEQELETAKRRRAEARDALDAAREHRESAAAERHRLRTELAKAERAVTRADDRITKATDNVDAAESALDRARHRLTDAKAGRLS